MKIPNHFIPVNLVLNALENGKAYSLIELRQFLVQSFSDLKKSNENRHISAALNALCQQLKPVDGFKYSK